MTTTEATATPAVIIPAAEAKAPICVEKPKDITHHGHTRSDPFYWLRERENPDVKSFLEKETQYCKEVVAGQGAPELEKKLFEEMKLRWKETDTSLPVKDKNSWYYSRTVKGLNYKIYCRRPYATATGFADDFCAALKKDVNSLLPDSEEEEIMIDLNKVSKDEGVEFVALGDYDVAPNETTVAFTLDLSDGNETYTIIVKDFKENKKDGGKEVQRIKGEIDSSVLCENEVLLYFTLDDAHRPEKLHRQKIGSETSEVLFTEPDETFWPGGPSRSDDDQYVTFSSENKLSGETYYMKLADLAKEGSKFQSFWPRTPKMEYALDHHCDLFGPGQGGWLITHNGDGCTNFKVDCLSDAKVAAGLAADAANPAAASDKKNWSPFLSYDPAVNIEGMSGYKSFLEFTVRKEGFSTVLVMPIAQAQEGATGAKQLSAGNLENLRDWMTFDDEQTRSMDTVEAMSSGDFQMTKIRVAVCNLIIPYRVALVDPVNGGPKNNAPAPEILKSEVVNGYDASQYKVERIWVAATQNRCDPKDPEANLTTDGSPQMIPVSIAYRTDKFKKDGTNPCLLYSYGSYGMSIDPEFSSSRVSLLDRGFVYALASIRGGGEMGRQWRNAGRMDYKMNTFTDFVDVGRQLKELKYVHPEKLAACGRSAGGMLMGAITNLDPNMWRTVIAGVPFVDCTTTMLDPTIPLTIPEWDEWGNPLDSEKYYKIINEYSPMDNIPGDQINGAIQGNPNSGKTSGITFPNMWITSGLTDPRVAYWEPAAWTCRLRKLWESSGSQQAGRFLCHKCVIGAGHSGSSGRYKHLEETAQEYSFLLQTMGIKE